MSTIDDETLTRLSLPSPLLLRWAMPELAEASRELQRRLDQMPLGPAARRLAELAVAQIPGRVLIRLLYRPLILELNVMRERGLLRGKTPTDRFDFFTDQLRFEPFREALWSKYPVARTELVRCLTRWNDNVAELISAFDEDQPVLRDLVLATDLLPEVLTLAAGDSHRGGKTVAVIGLKDGERLIYKPRPGSPEVLFSETVGWANRSGFTPPMPATLALDRGEHSWVRATDQAEAVSERHLRAFYQRAGGLIALSYVLSLTDVHRENLIAAESEPTIIDLETMMHTSLRAEEGNADPEQIVRALTTASVLITGLLPSPRLHQVDGELHVSDVSGLSGDALQTTALGEPWFDGIGTDAMRVSVRKSDLGAAQNVPHRAGVAQSAVTFEQDILDGFERMYTTVQQRRDELIAADGPLSAARTTPVRHITGASEMFARMLWNSYHPDFLRVPGARATYLRRVLTRHENLTNGHALAVSEHRQLIAGDIPIFHAAGNGLALIGGDGTVVPDVLRSSPVDALKHRLGTLSDQDCDYQRSVIKGSLRSVVHHRHGPWPADTPHATAEEPEDHPGHWAASESGKIGQYLLGTAAWVDGQPHWLNYELQGGAYWTPRPAGDDLYAGRAGIGIFLARLGQAVDEDQFIAPAARILDGYLTRSRDGTGHASTALGFASAPDGAIALATTMADLTGDSEPLETLLERYFDTYHRAIEVDDVYDVIGGTAGTLLTLLSTTLVVPPSRQLLAVLEHGCELLSSSVHRSENVMSWPSAIPSVAPVSGFSHGTAGIALALAKTAELVGATRFDGVVESALRSESARFDSHKLGWPDARPGDDRPMFAWCHGTPGVALARASMPSRFRTAAEEDLRKASALLERTYNVDHLSTSIDDLSLCHGLLGNLMIIDTIKATNAGAIPERVRDYLDRSVRLAVQQHGWACGAPSGLRTVDLFTGVAGVGLGLLALSRPGAVPNVLAGEFSASSTAAAPRLQESARR